MIQVQATGVFGPEAATADEDSILRTFLSSRYTRSENGDGYDTVNEKFILRFDNYKQSTIITRCQSGAWIFVSGTLAPEAINGSPVIVVKTMELKELPPFPPRESRSYSRSSGYRKNYGYNGYLPSVHGRRSSYDDISDCDYSNYVGDHY